MSGFTEETVCSPSIDLALDSESTSNLKERIKSALRAVGLHAPLVEARNWIIRPQWWRRERRAMRFFSRMFRRGDLVFDIGANAGDFTARMIRLGARVVSVEPQPGCSRRMRQRFAEYPEVAIADFAVGAHPGCARMLICRASQVSSLVPAWKDRFPNQQWLGPIDVPLTTLDALIARHGRPVFCKVDVEGFELEVLRGLSAPIPRISLEFTPGMLDQATACVDRLAELGYQRFNYSVHGAFRFALPRSLPLTEACRVFDEMPSAHRNTGGDLYAFATPS